MSNETKLAEIRRHAENRLAEARKSLEDAEPQSARFMWATVVTDEMTNLLNILRQPIEP